MCVCSVEAIYPVHDPVALQDRRVHSLIQYAMKVSPTLKEHTHSTPAKLQHKYKLLCSRSVPDTCCTCKSKALLLCVHAVQVEKAMFDSASNREDYYKLLAQKIYHIRKELEDRKKIKKG